MPDVTLTIDEKTVTVPPDTTIHKAAQSIGIFIPTICYHESCSPNALCRICVVEVEGARTLVASCIARVSESMVVHTQTERVQQSRKMILELLDSSVDVSEDPVIQGYIREYQADPARFPEAANRSPDLIDDNSMFVRDYSKCILCWRCVQVCAEDAQYTFAINFSNRGYETSIDTFYEKPMPETTCVFCGQCVGVCPTGALKPKREWLLDLGYTPTDVMQLTRTQRKERTPNPGR